MSQGGKPHGSKKNTAGDFCPYCINNSDEDRVSKHRGFKIFARNNKEGNVKGKCA